LEAIAKPQQNPNVYPDPRFLLMSLFIRAHRVELKGQCIPAEIYNFLDRLLLGMLGTKLRNAGTNCL
jgi:hypothetical protein